MHCKAFFYYVIKFCILKDYFSIREISRFFSKEQHFPPIVTETCNVEGEKRKKVLMVKKISWDFANR